MPTRRAAPRVALRARTVPANFASHVRDAAKKHGEHSHAFRRAVDRAFFVAHADDIANATRALRRDVVALKDALVGRRRPRRPRR